MTMEGEMDVCLQLQQCDINVINGFNVQAGVQIIVVNDLTEVLVG